MKPTRRTGSAFERAEAAFKSATAKPVEAAPKPATIPEGKELVSLRLDRAVLEHFQEDGPGWQDRINAALRQAAGLDGA
ncbi:MAG: BrnA antitoxin family protein [Hoeflea sp.]|uniref:BrnA antitoxin family protein n=1 Tax=Hoeflea sp. TaxID=1940281 RepID=UPI001D2C541A|nr:BrnA antitoxin family protein [Hoeflea sp.]MBU4530429.1 BrnA antitoxin family protein [Alphaproteobacteria bacterium]MBU4545216.1 BrnA antitoxin family protein [Alphaproteobacteria bacterium]MBU4549584.1 BrnA antitoxin family protein [Alphaproteobacteria bacterium]MBV1722019.1 BrnA antitoxin family protein [Hoeflea sp.]MBV1761369.1 BrnA antitoxin family protein [Hoeflea sp.]